MQKALRERFTGAKPTDVVQGSLEILREVSTILTAKAPGDASAFKAWLTDISRKVAEASSEGGGVQVSDAEKAGLGDNCVSRVRILRSRGRLRVADAEGCLPNDRFWNARGLG